MLPVGTGSVPAGSAAVARFDPADGLPALTVVQPRAVPPDHAAVVRRRELARALLADPETLAPRPAAEALAAGEVDPPAARPAGRDRLVTFRCSPDPDGAVDRAGGR